MSEEKIYGDFGTYVSLTAFLVTGLLLIWSGVNYVNGYWHFMTTDPNAYNLTKIIMSSFVAILALFMFSRYMITEGIMTLFISLSSLSFSIGSLLLNVSGYEVLDFMLSIGIYIASFMLLHRGNHMLGTAGLCLAVSISFAYLIKTDGLNVVTGGGLLASGIIMIYYASGNLILGDTGKNIMHVTQSHAAESAPKADGPYALTVVAGLYTFATMELLVGYQFIFVDYISIPYCVAEMLMALTLIMFAMFAVYKGMIPEGTLILMFGLSCLTFSTVALSGFSSSFLVDLMISAVIVVIGVAFVIRKDRMLGISALLFSAGGFTEVAGYYLPGGILILAAGAIMFYYAVSRWIVMETGTEPLRVF
jgi:hypothetical protein